MDVPIDGSIERSTVLYVSSFFLSFFFSLSFFFLLSPHHSRTLIFTPRFSPSHRSSFVPLSLPSRLHTAQGGGRQGERGEGAPRPPRALAASGLFVVPFVSLFMKLQQGGKGRREGWTEIESPRDPVRKERGREGEQRNQGIN